MADQLKIEGYEADKSGPTGTSTGTFTAQINPASISVKFGINYGNDEKTIDGSVIPQKKYSGCESQIVSFELIIDVTGVVPMPDLQITTVDAQVEKFKKACYYFVGSQHEIPYVKIFLNGESLFKYNNQPYHCRIQSFDVTYTLFSPEGKPLRAKLNTSFVGTMDPETEAKLKDKQSPDLTHMITVKAGDTLPILCRKIYGDRQMFHEIARINNLVSFRHIEPGTKLIFPPIK